jgi:hypothetical protein
MYCKEYPNSRCISITAYLVLTTGHAVTKAKTTWRNFNWNMTHQYLVYAVKLLPKSCYTSHNLRLALAKVYESKAQCYWFNTQQNTGQIWKKYSLPFSGINTFHTRIGHYMPQFVERTVFRIRRCIPNILFIRGFIKVTSSYL